MKKIIGMFILIVAMGFTTSCEKENIEPSGCRCGVVTEVRQNKNAYIYSYIDKCDETIKSGFSKYEIKVGENSCDY